LAVDLPEPPPPSPATTRPEIAPAPKPVPDALHHTQLYLDAKEAATERAPSTPGEMMEAILEGNGDAPGAAIEPDEPEIPETHSNSATQFFPGESALELPPPPEEDFFQNAPGFASLSLDYGASSSTELPPALPEVQGEPSFSSFSELAPPSAPVEEMPLIEATVVEEVEPLPPHLATTQPSIPLSPDGPSGMEFFANDPFQAVDVVAPPPTSIATDNPFPYEETSVAASLPTRPRTEELDLDIAHFFTGDEPE
jgi:hypothetical protein